MKRTFALVVLITLTVHGSLFAREITSDTPAWILMEFGKEAYEAQEYGDALLYFRLARQKKSGDADAEYWIGRVFDAESDFQLAALQYERALEQQSLLYVPRDTLRIKYSRAELYAKYGSDDEYLSALLSIIESSSALNTQQANVRMTAVFEKLLEEGYDRTVQLYRFADMGIAEAHFDIGLQLYRNRLPADAVTHLLVSSIMVVSEVVQYLREKDPDFEYTNLPDLFDVSRRWSPVQEYIASHNFIGNLYYLGSALWLSDLPDAATAIWESAASVAVGTPWFDRIIRQINDPWFDTL